MSTGTWTCRSWALKSRRIRTLPRPFTDPATNFVIYIPFFRNLIIEEKSFVPCEELIYGRMSFQGFNPEVEVCL